ncbi:MAG: GAF domain-containing protein [Endomicrobiia bacterium]
MSKSKEFEEIFEIVRDLTSTLDVDTLLKRISEAAEKLTNSTASSIMLVDDDKQHLYFKTAGGEKGSIVKKIKIKIGEGIAGSVALNKKSEIINDVSKDTRFLATIDQQSGFKTKSILAVPILYSINNRTEVIGVLEVLNKKDAGGFGEEDKKMLENLASLASIAIMNAKIWEDQRNFFNFATEFIISAIETIRSKQKGFYWKIAQTATKIAKKLGLEPSMEEYKNIYFGSLLHDIGYLSSKFKSDNGIEKVNLEKLHVIIGAEMVSNISLFKGLLPTIKFHHENYDGTGYPEGLSGDKIPLSARVISLAEYIEELKINFLDKNQIISLLKQNSNIKFDPSLVEIAINILSEESENLMGV